MDEPSASKKFILDPTPEHLSCPCPKSVLFSPPKLRGFCTCACHLQSRPLLFVRILVLCAEDCGPFFTCSPPSWGGGLHPEAYIFLRPTFLSPHPFHSSRCFSNSKDAAGDSSIQGGFVWGFFGPKKADRLHTSLGGAQGISRSYVFRLIFCNVFREKRLYYFFIQPAMAIFGVYHANHAASVLLTGSIK
ncbi:UNVERIFIED_CONTAM: hypothetical protein K2H54_021521 [Gekko kuhli]